MACSSARVASSRCCSTAPTRRTSSRRCLSWPSSTFRSTPVTAYVAVTHSQSCMIEERETLVASDWIEWACCSFVQVYDLGTMILQRDTSIDMYIHHVCALAGASLSLVFRYIAAHSLAHAPLQPKTATLEWIANVSTLLISSTTHSFDRAARATSCRRHSASRS